MTRDFHQAQEFKCAHCHTLVCGDPLLSGVRNRNHCPYCLWSRHLDLYQAGDRLSACKGGMQPVGLTVKRTRKKYRGNEGGELMLIHRCVECGGFSINRIAADDDADKILDLYVSSMELDDNQRVQFETHDVQALDTQDWVRVAAQLFGLQSISSKVNK